jgi:hypothetical protein
MQIGHWLAVPALALAFALPAGAQVATDAQCAALIKTYKDGENHADPKAKKELIIQFLWFSRDKICPAKFDLQNLRDGITIVLPLGGGGGMAASGYGQRTIPIGRGLGQGSYPPISDFESSKAITLDEFVGLNARLPETTTIPYSELEFAIDGKMTSTDRKQ